MRVFWIFLAALVIVDAPAIGEEAAAKNKSADGVDFPKVEFPIQFPAAPATHPSLTDVVKMIGHPPRDMAARILNSDKSKKALAMRLMRKVSTSSTVNTTRGNETVSGTRTINGAMTADWFAWDVAGADVVGFDLTDGVISRIVLYYKNPEVAKKKADQDYPGDTPCPWVLVNDNGAVRLEADFTETIHYIVKAQIADQKIAEAMKRKEIIRGMSKEAAVAMFGKPYHEHDNGKEDRCSWQVKRGEIYGAVFVDGMAVEIEHDDVTLKQN
jgi:hypothetical protein